MDPRRLFETAVSGAKLEAIFIMFNKLVCYRFEFDLSKIMGRFKIVLRNEALDAGKYVSRYLIV